MVVAYTGTQDEPVIVAGSPTFEADMEAITAFFAARSLRRFSTVALLLASSGSATDAVAVATNAPGALFRYNGSGWDMHGVAVFADAAARTTALSAPKNGWRSRLVDTGLTYVYFELYNSSTMPGGRKTAGWYLESPATLHLREEQASGTNGGTFTSGAWQKRTLNTALADEIGGASVSSSAITLPAGTYEVDATAPAYYVNENKLRLYQTSGTPAALLIGQSGYSGAASNGATTHALLRGRFTLAASQTVELQHRCTTTRATTGFGIPVTYGDVEVFADIIIRKVG